MAMQSKWLVTDEIKNQITRASTIRPRLEYATELVDGILDALVQKKFELHKNNLDLYTKDKEDRHTFLEFGSWLNFELEICYAVEALRQVRRKIECVFGLVNIVVVLAPTISIVRIVRSKLHCSFPETDVALGELRLVLGGLIIDTGHLTDAKLDFEQANCESRRLLDEAKLIADSKISKQFPNLDLS